MKKTCLALFVLLSLLLGAPALADSPRIYFSLESGFYTQEQTLIISTAIPGAKIYYTTDGSVPDETDTLYTGPITLCHGNLLKDTLMMIPGTSGIEDFIPKTNFPTGHVIRAVAVSPWGSSEVISGTFMVGYDREKFYGDTAIIFLMTDPDGLFDYDNGIYVLGKHYDTWKRYQTARYESWQTQGNFSLRGKEWERPVSVAFLDDHGGGFTMDMGLRIKGGATRSYSQKSFKLIADRDYGEKNLRYVLFPDNVREEDGGVVDRYKSFSLRSGANDYDHAVIRDPLLSNLVTGMRFETQNSKPCIAFLNGEFWGLYTLMEEYSDNYIQYHYGVDNENVVMVKRGKLEEGTMEDFQGFMSMFSELCRLDMSKPENYARAQELIDVESFADQCALLLYTVNNDGMLTNNNWMMWRVREVDSRYEKADGRWRMMVYDSEFAAGLYEEGRNYDAQNILPILRGYYYENMHPAKLFKSLVKSPDFVRTLVTACCDVRNLYMPPDRVKAQLDDMAAEYEPHYVKNALRYGPSWINHPAHHFQQELAMVNTFFEGRYLSFMPILQEAFDLGRIINITVEVEGAGSVYLNGRTIPLTEKTRVRYFNDYPITAQAVADEGSRFVRWEVNRASAVLGDAQGAFTEVTFENAFTLTAVFE